MKEITIQVFTKKEADEIIKKYPKKDLRKVALIDKIVEDTRSYYTIRGKKIKPVDKIYKANTVYILEEYIEYPTATSLNDDGTVEKGWCFGKAHKIFKEETK